MPAASSSAASPGRSTAASTKVEVRVDDNAWQEAKLGPDAGIDYWRQWYLPWDALPGRHSLRVRSVARTRRVWRPGVASHGRYHWRQ